MADDAELIQRYVDERDQRAFQELVQRHLALVYAAALRRTHGNAALAADVAQQVFVALARKAPGLRRHPALVAWLHRSTRYAAIDAVRAEVRRERLAQSLMQDPSARSSDDSPPDWERLRPVIDEALDELKDDDREAVLLRYFSALSFGEMGERLHLSENAARMRTERALGRLRAALGRRGITSGAAALGLALAGQTFGAVPAGLGASVMGAAQAAAPAGVLSLLLMNKILLPSVTALVTASLTYVTWNAVIPAPSRAEVAALRDENVRLTTSAAASADPKLRAEIAGEIDARAAGWVDAMDTHRTERRSRDGRQARTAAAAESSALVHRDRGLATALEANLTSAWAMDGGEIEALSRMLWFDGTGRQQAGAILATMPTAIQARYPTVEQLYAFFLVASTLGAPPPAPDILEHMQVRELRPGRVVLNWPGQDAPNAWQYQQTPEGWKMVLPEHFIKPIADAVLNQELPPRQP